MQRCCAMGVPVPPGATAHAALLCPHCTGGGGMCLCGVPADAQLAAAGSSSGRLRRAISPAAVASASWAALVKGLALIHRKVATPVSQQHGAPGQETTLTDEHTWPVVAPRTQQLWSALNRSRIAGHRVKIAIAAHTSRLICGSVCRRLSLTAAAVT